MSFDYGAELYTPVASAIRTYLEEGNKTLLLDADFICYLVGFCSDHVEYLNFKRQDKPFESEIWESKKVHVKQLIAKAVEFAGCDSVILFLTDSKTNFRLKLVDYYKGQRQEEKPPFFQEAKDYMLTLPNARLSVGCEADDEVSIEAWKRIDAMREEGIELDLVQYRTFSNFVISSQDKDLNIIPSLHCHPTTGEKYWASELGELVAHMDTKEVNDYERWPVSNGVAISPHSHSDVVYDLVNIVKEYCMVDTGEVYKIGKKKGQPKLKKACIKRTGDIKYTRVIVGKKESPYVKKLSGTGLHFFYSQLLTGDVVDNYKGLEGYGNTQAYELLKGSESEQELYDKVSRLYLDKLGINYHTYLLEQMRLAWMQTYRDEMFHPQDRGLDRIII
jgi:hypothetical protein